ncbi:MAG: tyrosine-type recombinase/integrase [Deltaproteobacteria bacterium]|nr:tyrosine-type recombinase/integrase [Deltaproteobacteria bacterium]
MKSFKSFLAKQLKDYVEYRINTGFAVKTTIFYLKNFDQYVKEKNATWQSFTPSFFIEYRATRNFEARTLNNMIPSIRVFFKFLIRKGKIYENPLQDIPALPNNSIVPFIFSPEEVDHLLCAAYRDLRKTERYFLWDYCAYISIILMARCGLRISEPARLLANHYRPDEKTIYIEKTKFKKDRLIPIPESVASEINNLVNVKNTFLPEKNQNIPYLLTKDEYTKLERDYVARRFKKAVKDIKLEQPRRVIGTTNFLPPTPHSLRHSFAVNTLKRIKEKGRSPQNALPVLAVYMGHSEYKHTTKYLKVLDAVHRRQMLDFSMSKKYEAI